jgi:DNA ligase-1
MDFAVLAETFEQLEGTGSRLSMTDILAGLFKQVPAGEIKKTIYLIQGRVAPTFIAIEIGMGEKFVEQAISLASGYKMSDVEKKFRETGDLGLVAEAFISKKTQKSLFSKKLEVSEVCSVFYKIATVSGTGSQDMKIKLLTQLLNNAGAKEAKFLVRIPLGMLRLGIGDPTILDSFSVKTGGDKTLREPLERAYNLCSDLGLVAETLWKEGMKGIKKFEITPGNPVRPALAERLPSAEEITEKLGECAVEAKYDGFRIQVHKDNRNIQLFSRRQENTTHMFPEIVKAVSELPQKKVIMEGEALSYNEGTGEYYPFQMTIQRKRKHDVKDMAKAFPLKLFVFDVLYVDGKDYTQEPFSKRRKMVEKLIKPGKVLLPSEMIITDKAERLDEFFHDCVSRGLEGIIAKDLNAPYVAGARKFAWIKLKRSYKGELSDTIDVVIVGYYRGAGARAQFGFGGFLAAVYDEEEDMFKTITKCGSGFSEKQMTQLKDLLDRIKVKSKPARVDSLLEPHVWTEPKYVVSLMADEITESPMHTAGRKKDTGYALRFPRMASWIREDKKPEDATTVKEITEMYKQQKRVLLEEQP